MQKVSKEYLLLFNAITDAEESLRRLQARLIDAQQKAEELFITDDEADPLSRNIYGPRRTGPPLYQRPAVSQRGHRFRPADPAFCCFCPCIGSVHVV